MSAAAEAATVEETTNIEPGEHPHRKVEEPDSVVIRFVGDSGDGMQLTGQEFSRNIAEAGNAFATHPDFPSEIRAPASSLFGVSGYQIQFASRKVFTSGDQPDVLVAMNPAALKTNLADVRRGGIIIVNSGAFTAGNLNKAGYQSNPLEDGTLAGYMVYKIDISDLTARTLKDSGLTRKEIGRSKNYYALGVMLALYNRPLERQTEAIRKRFAKKPAIAEANVLALRAGYAYADATEMFLTTYRVHEADITPGTYRSITGNQAMALGVTTVSEMSGLQLFLGSYPITPATDILHELSALKHFNVTTFQAEDEIAGICSAIGASYGGALGMTTTSGPGMALKTEALGLAVMLELPLVVINVQRGGPSTGLPTKIEQSDLLQALYGRNGESPIPVLAARSPADSYDCVIEAFRMAIKYMTPVILLSDGGLGNATEPWRIPELDSLPDLTVKFRTDPEGFQPYARDEHLARAWVRPGTPGLEHRIGGLEKDWLTGAISQDPRNHQRMVDTRAAKVAGIAADFAPLGVTGPKEGKLIVVGWGSTYGPIVRARQRAEAAGRAVAHLHLRHLNPLPSDLGEVLARYETVLVPEMNQGQLAHVLRDHYLIDVVQLNKVEGRPFKVSEIYDRILELC